MPIAATLIAADTRPLKQGEVDAACQLLSAACQQKWLSAGRACDILLEGEVAQTLAVLEPWALENKLDVIVQNAEGRAKKALLADMESTIIHQEMLDELAAHAGIEAQVKEITARAMNGELDFKAALAERLRLLKGVPETVVNDLKRKITIMEGAAALVTAMRQRGVACVLVSGGFTCFIEPVAKALGFTDYFGNVLEIKDGAISGAIVEPLLTRESKRAILAQTAQNLGVAEAEILAVGDGANDIPMLQAAGLGVAYHGKPNVQKAAPHNIRFADLRALIWAQGYSF